MNVLIEAELWARKRAHLVLASGSARRLELLEQVGFSPAVCSVDIDEQPKKSENPVQLVARLSLGKAIAGQKCYLAEAEIQRSEAPSFPNIVVVGADTVIDLDGVVLGKPKDRQAGLDGLLALSNREHQVHTGVSVLTGSSSTAMSVVVTSRVRFGTVSESQAESYWNTGESVGKAGGYAIQGIGAQFVAHLSGSYTNVVGLPLYETLNLLKQALESFQET